tara:strand:+ start:353 stop:1690 length:1338 start_codon:yes stop_codon:yes gene_type:complete
MATTYLTQTTTAGSMVQWTWSAWVKRSGIATEQNIFTGYNAATDYTEVRFDASDRLNFQNRVASSIAGELQTRRVFRDTSGWYNIVIVWDTGNGVAGDRMKMYVNGVQETDFIGVDNPTLNKDSNIGEASVPTHIGSFATGSNFFDGSMSYVCFIDGQALTASSFGETDATTGEWKIKAIASGGFTWGANGYMILKDGDTITDQSTNSNDFTLGAGTLTNTEDCPSDVFATMNPLDNFYASSTFSNGSNTVETDSTNYSYNTATIGNLKGKFYFEVKIDTSDATDQHFVGISGEMSSSTTDWLGKGLYDWAYHGNAGNFYNNASGTAFGSSYTAGDYIGVYIDLDNNKLYFAKNGVMVSTTGKDITTSSSTPNGIYLPALGDWASASGVTASTNFGNGCFGTTQLTGTTYQGVGSIGIFKYDPQSITLDGVSKSFTAFSTKGLQE